MGSEFRLLEHLSINLIDGDRGKKYPKQEDFSSKGYCLFLSAKNVTKTGFEFDQKSFITKEKDEALRAGKLVKGDIILTTRGTVGNVAFYDERVPFENVRINSGMMILRADLNVWNRHFLYFVLTSQILKTQIESLISGSAVPQLPARDINKFLLPQIEKSQQNAIVQHLANLNSKITLNRQINQTLEQMAQALFKSWFVDFDPVIDNALDADNPIPDALAERAALRQMARTRDDFQPLPDDVRQLFPNEFEESELGWIPKGWGVGVSGDLIDVRDGTHDSPKKSETGFPLVTSKNLTTGTLDLSSAYLISEDDYIKVNARSNVEFGDILLTMIGTIGVPYLVSIKEVGFAIKNIGLFRTSERKEFSNYFYFLLKTSGMQDYLESRSAGTTQKYLSLKVLRNINFVVPSDHVLDLFNSSVELFVNKSQANFDEIESLTNLRDTLLPKLISGKLRLDSPEVEKAKSLAEAV